MAPAAAYACDARPRRRRRRRPAPCRAAPPASPPRSAVNRRIHGSRSARRGNDHVHLDRASDRLRRSPRPGQQLIETGAQRARTPRGSRTTPPSRQRARGQRQGAWDPSPRSTPAGRGCWTGAAPGARRVACRTAPPSPRSRRARARSRMSSAASQRAPRACGRRGYADAVTLPGGARRGIAGADGEAEIETAARQMIDGHRALGEPRGMMGRRIEGVGDRRADAGVASDQCERAEHRPAVVGEAPQAVAVRDARVAELVGETPEALAARPRRSTTSARRGRSRREHPGGGGASQPRPGDRRTRH